MTSTRHLKYRLSSQLSGKRIIKAAKPDPLKEQYLKYAELASIFADTNGTIFCADTKGRILAISSGWTKLLGYGVPDIIGITLGAFTHPEDIPYCTEAFHKLLSTKEPVRFEYRLRHQDGGYRWHSNTLGPIKDRNGNILFLVGIATDITEQKTLEQALIRSEERFHKAFEANPDAITISNLADGRYIDVNEAFLKNSGYERHEVIGHTTTELGLWANDKDREVVLDLFRTQGYIHNVLMEFRLKSGIIRTYDFSGVLVDMGGETHLVGIIKDVHQLKKSEEKFSKAFNSSPTPMAITTMQEGIFIDVNTAFCRMVGYQKEELLGATTFDIRIWVNPEQRREVQKMLNQGVPVRDYEGFFRKKSGEERWGLLSVENIEIEGRPCILNILTDVTDQKKAEEEIRYLSFHDRLTGLYNRNFFEEELNRLDTERQLPISIIMGDVNGLKLINDALGHHEGDKHLITVANAMRQACRTEDIVARWGGDEFIIVLPGTDYEVASRVVKRILNSEIISYDLPIQTSISLGIATKTHEEQDIQSIIKEAEDKMYRKKLLENKSTRSYFLNSLEKALWTRSHETREHCQRLEHMAIQIAGYLGLPASDMDNLRLLAALHDIGKIAIPNNILEKPDKLSPEEWETIKKHPEVGYRIALSSAEMAPIAEAVLHHHERWDGTGYPFGLIGQEIPFLSRLISIVDTYDVMVNGRPYQAAVSSEAAWAEIISMAGSQFDPELVSIISTTRFQ